MGFWDMLSGGLGLAGGIFDLINGYKANQTASEMAGIAAGTAAKQDEYTDYLLGRLKADDQYENLNLQYLMEDIQKLRPAYNDQTNYQIQRLGEQLNQAKSLNPILDRTEQSLINTLTKGPESLRKDMMNQATTDVSLAYGNQRAQDTRTMGLAGINPNSGQSANYINRMGQSEALANAAARTTSARQAEDLALSRNSAALNYAKGAQLPTYGYSQQVNSGDITNSAMNTGNLASGMYGAAYGNAQDSFNGFGYAINQLTNGLAGQMGTQNKYA